MSGDKIPQPNKRDFLLEFPKESEVKKFGRRYVKVWLTDEVTDQKAVGKYIRSRWPKIRNFLQNEKRRKKNPKHPDLVVEIMKLDRLSTEALYRMANATTLTRYYRHQLIKKILMLKSKNAEDYVRKTIIKYRKKLRAL